MAPANIRVNAQVPFPSLVIGVGPIYVAKSYGVWRIGFDPNRLPIVVPSAEEVPNTYMIVHNTTTNQMWRVSMSFFSGGGGDSANVVNLVTTDDTPTNFPSTFTILPYSSWGFEGEIIARDTATGDSSKWRINGAAKQMADLSTTALVDPVTAELISQDAGAAAWNISVSARTTVTGGINVTAQGEDGHTIYWQLRTETEHVTTPAAPPPELNLFIAGGKAADGNAAITISEDGEAWERQTFTIFGTGEVSDIARDTSGKILAVGHNGTVASIALSTDGSDWESVAFTAFGGAGSAIRSVAFGAGKWLVVGLDESLAPAVATAESASGPWTLGTFTAFGPVGEEENRVINKVRFGAGLFVLAGRNSDDEQAIATSTDGLAFTAATPALNAGTLYGAGTDAANYFAVGQDDTDSPPDVLATVQRSTNGVAFTQQTLFTSAGSTKAFSLDFINSLYIAGVLDEDDSGPLFTSTTGLGASWTRRTVTDPDAIYHEVYGASFGASKFISVGARSEDVEAFQAFIAHSDNGTTGWTAVDSGLGGDGSVVRAVIFAA